MKFDATWDPVTGCSYRSEGCLGCLFKNTWVGFHEDLVDEPLSFGEDILVRLCSQGDFFHNQVKTEWQLIILDMINRSRATFLILTKRPCIAVRKMLCDDKPLKGFLGHPRIQIGIVAENQEWAFNRLPHLFMLDFPMRFCLIKKEGC